MQRRAPSTVAAAAPGLTQDASLSSTATATTTLRRKKRKGLLSSSRRSSSLWDDDGLFFVLVGAMGCGLALFLVALAVRLANQWNWSAKLMHGSGRIAHVGDWNPHRKKAGHHPHNQNHGLGADDGGNEEDDELEPLPFNRIYRIPEAMETMGDRSSHYADLRKRYDTELLPKDDQRSLDFIRSVTKAVPPSFLSSSSSSTIHHSDQVHHDKNNQEASYDITNCPYEPPPNYPRQWKLVNEVLDNWPTDQTELPTRGIHQGLCQFDYTKEYDKALHYRELELPFVVVNDPQVARTAERWNEPDYVNQMVGPNVMHRAEYNTNNHFLYHMPSGPNGGGGGGRNGRRGLGGGRHGTGEHGGGLRDAQGRKAELQNKDAIPEALRMTYSDWLQKANVTADHASPTMEHWYYRLIGCGYMGADGSCDKGSTEALYDELPFFQPTHDNPLYLGDPDEQKGIHCRFGMKGVIAENHFDASRNAIALFYGHRRYILSHPDQCGNLALLPKQHPSARHSAVDYTHPDLDRYPEFAQAMGNEVVMQPGQVLYLPTNWFHYIVSLDLNYQCNTRSGATHQYWDPIHQCGF